MTVKEMIEKLQGMNPKAVVIIDEDWNVKNKADNMIDKDAKNYYKEWLNDIVVMEIEQSPDKKYVRVW